MELELVPLILFGIAAGFSPGPNNIVTSYSAFNFGFTKTIPTMLGVIQKKIMWSNCSACHKKFRMKH